LCGSDCLLVYSITQLADYANDQHLSSSREHNFKGNLALYAVFISVFCIIRASEDSLCREADSHRGSIDLTFREEGDGHHRILLQFAGIVGAGGGGGADTV
jgi:hypothetical protein